MTQAEIIGRVIMQTDYQKSESILQYFKPMLRHTKYVEQIFHSVQSEFSQETSENRRLIFIAVVYQVYQPLSFLENKTDKRAAGKLPAGVRDEIARCLNFTNSEMANHFKTFTEAQMKPFNNGPERPFKQKVMSIVERFKCFSINTSDTQFKMSL